MANELLIHYPTGATLYALLHDATGQVWNGSAFAAPGSANWTDYDITMAEVATATGLYRGTMPAAVAGAYTFIVRKQAGVNPAVGDIAVGAGKIEWSGTAEVALSALATATALATVNGKVDDILTDTGTTLDTLVKDIPTNAELATALGTADDAVLAAIGALNDISVADIIAGITDGTIDLQEGFRIMLAVLAGKSGGGGTSTIVFRDYADTKTRVSATVDSNGNRTAIILDGS
jgi:hypothetical protein